ncbi:MAG TPA: RraA family protein [Deltaproteobacteria bacterium]|nr:RraA family protein [Deltaproteobacteria bacterium]
METYNIQRPPKQVVEGFRSICTSTIADLLDEMGLKGIMYGIRPVEPGARMVGPAVTIKEVSGDVGTYTDSDFSIGTVIESAESGDILVFDNAGKEISTWGGLATTAAKERGIAGAVIDGGCRDADDTIEMGFPIFSRHITPTPARTRIKILEINGVVLCGSTRVCPGDIIVADRTGVVVVPRQKANDILKRANAFEKAETEFVESLKKGKTFNEMHQQTGRF